MTHIRRPEFLCLALALFIAVWAGGQPLMDALPGGGIVAALTGDAAAARLTRALMGLLVFGGLGYVLLTNRAVVTPKPLTQMAAGALVVSMGFAILFSSFPGVSLDAWLHWVLYVGVFLLAVASVGRKSGVVVLLAVLVGAAALVGLKGILEYGEIRAIEPTYRIFAGWSNPNALATLFCIAIPVGVGLSAATEGAPRIVGMVGIAASTAGLLLTQSKGGLLVLAIGLVAVVGLILFWKSSPKSLAAPALGLLLGGVIFAGLQYAPRPGAPAGASGPGLTRITGAGGEAEQSAGFRTLLWKSSVSLAAERPWGWGPGVFRFVSAKPGLVTQTVTAHQTWLQVLVEGGVLALVSFIGLAVLWLGRMFPGAKHLTEQQNTLRAGVVAGVIAAGAHGFIESSLSYAGVGVIVFALMGLSLQLASDGSAPEVMPKALRQIGALLCCVVPLFLLVLAARSESAKGGVLLAAQTQSPSIREEAQGLRAMAAGDGEASYLAALYGSTSPEERLKDLREAAKTFPSTKTLRQLARAENEAGRPMEAYSALAQALRLDPNNLPAHWLRFEMLLQNGETEQAKEAANDLIKVEASPAFNVRSLPEAVPTETYRVRLWLASQTESSEEKTRLVTEALAGMASFARLTIPQIIRFESGGATYAGVTSQEANEWLTEAKSAAASLPASEEVDKNRQSVADALLALESA